MHAAEADLPAVQLSPNHPMNMNRKFLPSLVASACLGVASASAGVSFSQIDAADNTPWAAGFGGGNLVASIISPTSGGSVPQGITGGGTNFFGQSFKGNGQQIEGWGFFGNGGNASALTYTITLLDYGTSGPIDTASEFNPFVAATTLVSRTFDLGGSVGKKQLYFDFDGADSVLLAADHYYSMHITAPATSSTFLHRVGGAASTYADGTGAIGTNVLNPDAFAGAGNLRDTIFGLYTATAVPEPSSFAALAGVVALGFGAARRRREVR